MAANGRTSKRETSVMIFYDNALKDNLDILKFSKVGNIMKSVIAASLRGCGQEIITKEFGSMSEADIIHALVSISEIHEVRHKEFELNKTLPWRMMRREGGISR